MISARPVLDEYFDALVAKDAISRKNALRTLNLAYFDIAQAASWLEMRHSVTLGHGDLLPANLIAVDAVCDDQGNFYSPRDRANVGLADRDPVRRWYFDSPVSDPLHRGLGFAVTKGSASVSFGASYTDLAGEWLVVPARLGFWKLASNSALTSAWMDDTLQNEQYAIRPIGQQRLGLMTELGADDTGTTVTVYYSAFPEPLTIDGGIIHLPSSEALMIRALRRHYKIDKKDLARGVSFNDEYDAAFSEMLARNPRFTAPAMPRDRVGSTTWGSSPR